MTARKFRAPSRLSQMIGKSGGKRARDAIRDSDAALAELREPCLSAIDVLLTELSTRFGPASARNLDDVERLFVIATQLIDAAAVVRDLHIDAAAHSLCRLLDVFLEAGQADWPVLDVHVEALRFLRASGPATPDGERETMVRGLGRAVDRVSVALGVPLEPVAAAS